MEAPSGRGRGRGRGAGVPVIPSGMWDEMHGNENNVTVHEKEDNLSDNRPDMSRFNDAGRGKVRPFEKDAKGVDWECTACSNINWSWRASCNRCGNAKPVTLLTAEEIRDGVGGGFNEYQERVSSANVEIAEDGFDDFGRRAKTSKSNKTAKELAALERLQKNYGFLMGTPAKISTSVDSEVRPKYATSASEREKFNSVSQPLPAPEVTVGKAALAREEAKKEAKDGKSSDKLSHRRADDRSLKHSEKPRSDSRSTDTKHRLDSRRSRSRDARRSSRDRRDRSRSRSRERQRSRERNHRSDYRDRSRERRR